MLLSCQAAYAVSDYRVILEEINKPLGDSSKGEIEIVLDDAGIELSEAAQKARLIRAGLSEEDAKRGSQSGIVEEDLYLMWVRDPVVFPNGERGTYNRLVWKVASLDGPVGVVVLPVLEDGRIILNLNYRHATRSWELELPRGGKLKGETNEAAAQRELKEETGFDVEHLIFLGDIAVDTGACATVNPVFMGYIFGQGFTKREYSEAIEEVMPFTVQELEDGLIRGFMDVPLHGELIQVPLRDSHLTFALLQARLRKLL